MSEAPSRGYGDENDFMIEIKLAVENVCLSMISVDFETYRAEGYCA
jgi:hypothetical protein